jgi:hypothetical protein
MANKISIVVPTRNRSALLRSTLRSIGAQTWSDREVIVVDEASTDDTAVLLASEFPEAKVVCHDVARGSSAARNAGIAAATGDWVFFLDDDDLIHPRHLEELLREALAAPPDCLVAGRYRDFAIVSGDVVLAPVICAAADRPDTEALIELVDPESQRTITHSTILWPRKLFETLRWDEELGFNEDYDLFGRLILAGKHIVGRDVGLYCVRMHSGPRVTTGKSLRRKLAPAHYWLKWSGLLQARPEYRACAAAMRNGLMVLLIDLSGLPAADEVMPLLLAAFKAWGGQRFYLTHPPRHWLKRRVSQAVLDIGGPRAIRQFFALIARLRRTDDDYVSSSQPAATDADRADAALIRTYG